MSIRRTALVGFLLCGVIAASGWTIAHALPLPDLQAQMAFVPKVNQTGPIKRATTTVNAEYPPEARGLGISADVSVGVTVGPAGDVLDAKAVAWGYHVQGDDGQGRAAFLAAEPIDRRFVNAAERAARLWRFEAGDAQWTTGIKFEFLAVGDNELVQVSSPNALPPLPAPGEPLRVGGSLKPPRMVKKVNPVYPAEARAGRVQGVVVIEARIGRDGSVVGTRVLRSVPLLDQAAIDAVRQWKYEPTVVDGEPVELLMVVTVNFSSTPAS
jgi:TonB family protein